MPIVRVARRFTLQLDPVQIGEAPDQAGKMVPVFAEARKIEFLPGTYDLPEEIADHWYLKANLEGYVPPEPADGTMQYAEKMLRVEQAVRMTEPVEEQGQKPADTPMPPGVERATPVHYFAGQPMPEPPLQGGPSWLPQRP
jgi:hypothetical protein